MPKLDYWQCYFSAHAGKIAVIKSGVFISLHPPTPTFSLHGSVSRSVSSFPPRRRTVLVLFSLSGLFISLDTVSSFSTHFAEKARVSAIFKGELIFFLQRVHIFFTHPSIQ